MRWKHAYQQLHKHDFVPYRKHSIRCRVELRAPGTDIITDNCIGVIKTERRHELTLDNDGDIRLSTSSSYPHNSPSAIRIDGFDGKSWGGTVLEFKIKFNGNIMYNIYAIGRIDSALEDMYKSTINIRYNLRSGKSYFRNYGRRRSVKPGQGSAQTIYQYVSDTLPEIREALCKFLAKRET
jgi:hypothetical protein